MIDALFGSKTRVKLLHLFLNNPGKSFYVREITRLIDEQINSVRRELSNLIAVGMIHSDSTDNKLYYQINQRYEYYVQFRAIFSDKVLAAEGQVTGIGEWEEKVVSLPGLRLAIAAGVLVKGSPSSIDLVLVGEVPASKLTDAIGALEASEGREVNYSLLGYEEFYYRLSIRDRFLTQIISAKHAVLLDTENLLSK